MDPGFPIGGGANPSWRGCQPLTHVLFGENICKNERIWSCWGGHVPETFVCRSATDDSIGYSGKILGLQTQFIRQLSEFFPEKFSEREQQILDVPKQLADYNISAQTVRKIERKYYKKWF